MTTERLLVKGLASELARCYLKGFNVDVSIYSFYISIFSKSSSCAVITLNYSFNLLFFLGFFTKNSSCPFSSSSSSYSSSFSSWTKKIGSSSSFSWCNSKDFFITLGLSNYAIRPSK